MRLIQAKVREVLGLDPGIQRLGRTTKAMRLAALDDLQQPIAGLGDDARHLRPLIAGP